MSVIIPAFDAARFLPDALEGARAQTWKPYETIVVDDGSTDTTAAVAETVDGVRCIRRPHRGVSAARNAGIAAAGGDVFAFLDADDVWEPAKTLLQLDVLRRHPHVGYVLCHKQDFLEPGAIPPPWLGAGGLTHPTLALVPSALLVRRAVIEEIGGFDDRFPIGGDREWFVRAEGAGIERAILPDVLLRRRIHDANLSAQKTSTAATGWVRALKSHLDRARTTGCTVSSDPLVSVIIPVYNGERYLAEAVESVLHQTYRPFEIIVVDDGSSDGTADVARQFGDTVRSFAQPNAGQGAALNLGIAHARGELYAFLDADDMWEPEKLAQQVAAMKADPAPDMVTGLVQQFFSPDIDPILRDTLQCPDDPMPGYCTAAIMVRHDAFDRVGPFETHLRLGEFMSWYMRAQEQRLSLTVVPQVVLRRRIHDANKGIVRRHAMVDRVRILKAALDRRRAADAP